MCPFSPHNRRLHLHGRGERGGRGGRHVSVCQPVPVLLSEKGVMVAFRLEGPTSLPLFTLSVISNVF